MENKTFEYMHILMQLYNIKPSDISNILGYDRTSVSRFFYLNSTSLASEQMLKDFCNFFNVKLNLFLNNDDCYCIKINNQFFNKNIYIDYKDYIFLKFKGIIVDEFKDKKEIVHNFKDEYLFLFDNQHIGRTFTNLSFLKELKTLDPNDMLLIKTESPNYVKQNFKSTIIKLLCLGYEEDVAKEHYEDILDYKNGYNLKENNETIKKISIKIYNNVLDYENIFLGEKMSSKEKEAIKRMGPVFVFRHCKIFHLGKLLNDDEYYFLINEYINNLAN